MYRLLLQDGMDIRVVKARRTLRRVPRVWLHEILEPIFNRGQLLTFFAAVVGLWLILQTATPRERDVQAFDWAISIEAFGIALVIWAAVSAVRAPLIVIRRDRELGRWFGTKFIYHEPLRVLTTQLEPAPRRPGIPVRMADAESGSLVRYSIEHTPPCHPGYYSALMGFNPDPGFIDAKWVSGGVGAIRLPADRTVFMHIRNPQQITVRVYLHWFDLGPGGD